MKAVARVVTSHRGMGPRAAQLALRIIVRTLGSIGLKTRSDAIQKWMSVCRNEFALRQQRELFMLLESGGVDVFLDLGAHLGEQAIPAAEHVPVFAFEPDPVAADQLRAIISSQHTRFPIAVFETAAWDSDGLATLRGHRRGPAVTGSSSLISEKRNARSGMQWRVRTVDIGRFAEQLPYQRILVKCDVEGAEYQVLRSLLRKSLLERLVAIYTEFHDAKIPNSWARSLRFSLMARMRRIPRSRLLQQWI